MEIDLATARALLAMLSGIAIHDAVYAEVTGFCKAARDALGPECDATIEGIEREKRAAKAAKENGHG